MNKIRNNRCKYHIVLILMLSLVFTSAFSFPSSAVTVPTTRAAMDSRMATILKEWNNSDFAKKGRQTLVNVGKSTSGCQAFVTFAFKRLYGHLDSTSTKKTNKNTVTYGDGKNPITADVNKVFSIIKAKAAPGDAVRINLVGTKTQHVVIIVDITKDNKIIVYEAGIRNSKNFKNPKDLNIGRKHEYTKSTFVTDVIGNKNLGKNIQLYIVHSKSNKLTNKDFGTIPTTHNLDGKLDSAACTGSGKVKVTGWALDKNNKNDVLAVKFYIGGELVLTRDANIGRPNHTGDLKKTHTFDGVVLSTNKSGNQYVTAVAYSLDGTVNKKLGSISVNITQAHDPVGSFDSITCSKAGTLTVKGYAYDQDASSSALNVDFYIGADKGKSGAEKKTVTANAKRSGTGVAATHSFDGKSFTTSKIGKQTVYAYAINKGGGKDKFLGSKTVTITPALPQITNVKISDVNESGYTVSCTVTVPSGVGSVSRVQFPTWTDASGKDDIQANWTTSSAASGTRSGNTYTYRVKRSDHKNEFGLYHTKIYAFNSLYPSISNSPVNYAESQSYDTTLSKAFYPYTVNFDANGGTGSMGASNVSSESSIFSVPACGFIRDGYEFAGWKVIDEQTGLTYGQVNGSNIKVWKTDDYYSSTESADALVLKEGNQFAYVAKSDGKSFRFVAQWEKTVIPEKTITIHYEPNWPQEEGRQGEMEDQAVTVPENSSDVIALDANRFSYKDSSGEPAYYAFSGWHMQRASDGKWLAVRSGESIGNTEWAEKNTIENGSGYEYALVPDRSDAWPVPAGSETLTLYAQWEEIIVAENKTITLHYDPNWIDPDDHYGEMEDQVETLSGSSTASIALAQNQFAYKDKNGDLAYYAFNGWTMQRASDGKWLAVRFADDISKAVWVDENTIENGDGGYEYALLDDQSDSWPVPDNNETLTLHAQWLNWHPTVTFWFNYPGTADLEKESDSVMHFYGSPASDYTTWSMYLSKSEGYEFTGWYTEPQGGRKVPLEETSTMHGEYSLYAHWEPMQITFTFDPNGGEGTMEPQTVTYDQIENGTASYDPNQFTREGYVFSGWNLYHDTSGYAVHYEKFTQEDVRFTLIPDGDTIKYFSGSWTIKYHKESGSSTFTLYDQTYRLEAQWKKAS